MPINKKTALASLENEFGSKADSIAAQIFSGIAGPSEADAKAIEIVTVCLSCGGLGKQDLEQETKKVSSGLGDIFGNASTSEIKAKPKEANDESGKPCPWCGSSDTHTRKSLLTSKSHNPFTQTKG